MKTKNYLLIALITLGGFYAKSQDLISIASSTWTWPEYTFNSSSNELSIQMTIKNSGWSDASTFDVGFVLMDVSNSDEYEIDLLTYGGLPFTVSGNQNILQITGLTIDLDFTTVPSGTYRLQARINEDQSAYESSYLNNVEYFGNQSFTYTTNSAGISLLTDEADAFEIYPNPMNGEVLYVGSSNSLGSMIRVVNVAGVSKIQANLSSEVSKIDIADLNSGIYFYQIVDEDGNVLSTGKLVNK